VTHIGSGFANEIDSSLDILLLLVEHHIHQMAPFAVFVKVSCVFMAVLTVLFGLLDKACVPDIGCKPIQDANEWDYLVDVCHWTNETGAAVC